MNRERRSFAFLAHWVEPWNWMLWFLPWLHDRPQLHWLLAPLAPVYWTMSVVYLFGRKGFDTVDEFFFNGALHGQTVLIRNFAWHFFQKGRRDRIRTRILEAVLEAQKTCQVIGLGALTKAEWLTRGGEWIVQELGDQLKAAIVHGDTLTAAVVVERVVMLRQQFTITTPIFITGATSKIGRAVILSLVLRGIKVVMYTKSEERFEAIRSEAGEFGCHIARATSLKDGKRCSLWITGKAVPCGKELLPFIPMGAVVLNFSVPSPLSPWKARTRPDITLIEGGLVAYNPTRTNLQFTMRLRHGVTYACHAGTMVHTYMGWTHHEVGPVDVKRMQSTLETAKELGFSLPLTKRARARRAVGEAVPVGH